MYHNHIKNLFNIKSFTRKKHWRLYQILFRFRQRHYNNLQVDKYTVLSFKMRIPPFPNDPQFSYFCPNISLWPTSRQWHVYQTLSDFFRFNLFYSASNMFRHQVLIICKHPDQSELIGLFFTQILLALAQTIFKFFRRKTSKGDRRHSELEDIEARGRVLWQLNFNFKTTFLKSYVLRGILR